MTARCIGGGVARDCERGECNALDACTAMGESTSARLRRVEAELGSALTALAGARRERDEARAKAEHWLAKTRELAQDLAAVGLIADSLHIEAGQCGWRGLAVQLMKEQNKR